MVTISLLLITLDYKNEQFRVVKSYLSYIVYPLQKSVDIPINFLLGIKQSFIFHKQVVEKNENLLHENLLLQAKLQRLAAIQAENNELRALLVSSKRGEDKFVAANILQVSSDPYTQQLYLDKGLKDGVSIGQAIIDSHGIMGSVITANDFTSKVMLMTDISSAIPVVNLRNNVRAIAIGKGNIGSMELQHIANTIDIQEGDIFVTSGLGGGYPPDYPVGVVTSIAKDVSKPFSDIKISPIAKLDKSRKVLLLFKQQDELP